jgi:3-deoxy-manno-octulosonate cytidylyltransferase (CMP-KDO synthetase)
VIRGRVVGVIPARLASTRLPRKVLREVLGEPLLGWVYRAAKGCAGLDEVVVAADSDAVMRLCAERGWRAVMTSPELASGTDRLCAVSRVVEAEIYVNVQGDEPLLEPEHIDALLAPFEVEHVEVTTLKVRCRAEDEGNPHAVKVVTAEDGRALYFSRAAIPYDRDGVGGGVYWKHLGVYAYRRAALERFAGLGPGVLEQTERLEQLRLLENGIAIHVAETAVDTVGVDTEEDLRRVEGILRERLDRLKR